MSLAFAASSSNNLTNVFSYNPANQITALTQSNLTYNYTEAQNRVGAYGVNSLNQYTSIDGLPVTHDANGNLTADGAGMTYTYDMENHLVATGGAKSSTLRYDVLGRLARISINGITTDFHYDGDALVGEYVGAAQKRRYVHGGQVDEPLVQYNLDTGAKLYLFADHQGSIIAHTTNAGSVAQTNSYDPYGIPGSANNGRFGYTGQAWLKELGLNYYKARIYAPKLGRFLQTDPIFYKDDMNLYAYVRNDPANKIDPSGRAGVPACNPNTKCPILGNPQSTGTPGHDTASMAVAKEMQASGKYESVHLNQKMSTVSGEVAAGGQQPDVAGKTASGQIDTVEILSRTQTAAQMDAKGLTMQGRLPEAMRGQHTTMSVGEAHANPSAAVRGGMPAGAVNSVNLVSAVAGLPGAIRANSVNPEMSTAEFVARWTGVYPVAVELGIIPPPPVLY